MDVIGKVESGIETEKTWSVPNCSCKESIDTDPIDSSPDDFIQTHNNYFSQFIGDIELTENDNILDKLKIITT